MTPATGRATFGIGASEHRTVQPAGVTGQPRCPATAVSTSATSWRSPVRGDPTIGPASHGRPREPRRASRQREAAPRTRPAYRTRDRDGRHRPATADATASRYRCGRASVRTRATAAAARPARGAARVSIDLERRVERRRRVLEVRSPRPEPRPRSAHGTRGNESLPSLPLEAQPSRSSRGPCPLPLGQRSSYRRTRDPPPLKKASPRRTGRAATR